MKILNTHSIHHLVALVLAVMLSAGCELEITTTPDEIEVEDSTPTDKDNTEESTEDKENDNVEEPKDDTDVDDDSNDDSNDDNYDDNISDGNKDEEAEGSDPLPEPEPVAPYDGERADDGYNDTVGSDSSIYWEQNNFSNTVHIVYSGNEAFIESSNGDIRHNASGAHIVIDTKTNSVAATEIILSGRSEDGSLKIYASSPVKLTLEGVELSSAIGPAINSQSKKPLFIHLADATTNYLTDSSNYQSDSYYLSPTDSDEDRKGALFAEGDMVLSGGGILCVYGRTKHAVATDKSFTMRAGATLVVKDAVKNGLHVKGNDDTSRGVSLLGGLYHANISGTAGKGIKCDSRVEISGGRVKIRCTGDATYDAEEGDTSSAAGIKSDTDMVISSGSITLESTGSGGKGLNVDGSLRIDGGSTSILTSGSKYTYSSSLTSSPKGVKVDGDITLNGGALSIGVKGVSDGSEGLESKANIVINDGKLAIQAYDDAINAASSITINGGRVYAYAEHNDGIDSNGTLHINGGLVIASGCEVPEAGFDTDRNDYFVINGGTVIGTAGSATTPSNSCQQNVIIYNGIQATAGSIVALMDSNNQSTLSYELPRSMNGLSLLISTPNITTGSYTLYSNATITNPLEVWLGWYNGGDISLGTALGNISVSGTITTVGSGGGPGGGGPGMPPGGGRPR